MTHVGIFAAMPPVDFGELSVPARSPRSFGLSEKKTERYVVRRVSNGILNRGPQADDERYTVFIDGELRQRTRLWTALSGRSADDCPQMDQQLILALLARGHPLRHIAARAEGAFFIAVVDHHAQAILFANDRFGQRPHYYCSKGSLLVLAPSIKACLAGEAVSARLDFQSVAEFFSFQCVMEERTLLSDVALFPAGSAAEFDLRTQTFAVACYHSWTELVADRFGGTFEEAAEEATFLFRKACADACGGNLRHGIYLSGGLDSRSILAAVPADKAIDTFSFGPSDSPDLVYAARCARAMATTHHEFVMTDGNWIKDIALEHTALAECGHSLVHAHNFWRAWDAGARIDINLHGHFGDLLFGGSYIFDGKLEDLLPSLLEVFLTKWGYGNPSIDAAVRDIAGKPADLAPAMSLSFARSLRRFQGLPPALAHDLFSLQFHGRKQIQYYMVHNTPFFESRTPFLDTDLLRFVLNLPADYRANRRLQIAALERMAPRLTRIPWAGTDLPVINAGWPRMRHRAERVVNALSYSVTGRKLFAPRAPLFNDCYPLWFSRSLHEWVRESLCSPQGVVRHLFTDQHASEILDRHSSGSRLTRYSATRIGAMLSMEFFLARLREASQ
jgi:asparagine synthase (glutamine-hydrolysing)